MSQPECALHGPDCRGRLQWHHVIPKQRIRRAWKSARAHYNRTGTKPWSVTKAIADERNRVWLCVYHHGQVEAKRLYVEPPESAVEFAREYGLEWSLDVDRERAA